MRVSVIAAAAVLCLPHFVLANGASPADSVRFICTELLGRPTTSSITVNLCADMDLDAYVEYGTKKNAYTNQTAITPYPNSVPFNIVVDGLLPNSTYFYRVRYRKTQTADFIARAEHSFRTAKLTGTAFTFAIQADPHLDTNSNPAVYALTLQNILQQNPDFLIDLGDTFMSEKLQKPTQDSITLRHLLLRSYYDSVCHSVPLYLVIGNHEGELGWLLDGTANNLAVMASNTRTKYYPNPVPDNFYSGNTKTENFGGLRQNYYAWEWGSALFVVLDPYWYTKTKPGWGWTLGAEQYNWLKNVVTTSQAKFKFVFCHQLVGGSGNDGRGGTEFAGFYEMGGRNADSTWGFDANRPGWVKTIHQLMVENHVNIYFHGHDHFYGKQDKDGIVYQEVPQPSLKSYTTNSASQYGYVNGVILPNRGYLLVTVTDTSANVQYIRTYLAAEENAQRHNKDVSHSYTLSPAASTTSVIGQTRAPDAFVLHQNFPNPFNPSTTIGYFLPVECKVTLDVYDVLGRPIARLVDATQYAGEWNTTWDAHAASGMYLMKLEAVSSSDPRRIFTESRKMVVVR